MCFNPSVFALLLVHLATHVSNTQIHGDLRVPSFAHHIRALTESFDSNLVDAKFGNSADICADRELI
jgi:hypothetical protein